MRVAVWTPETKDVTPGQRFRIEQWERFLHREGFDLTYFPFLDASTAALLKRGGHELTKAVRVTGCLLRRLRLATTTTGFDLVYVFRETALLGPAVAERVLLRRGLPFVFDFDDSVWIRYRSLANVFWSYLRCPGKTAVTCRLARHVMAGNDTLAEYARRHAPAVSVVPTTIDTDLYVPPPAKRDPGVVIGWMGSYSTGPYLELLRAVLPRLARRFRFRFLAVGAREFEVDGVDIEVRPWRLETELQDLGQLDIGVMPLPDAPWERGKCGLKALQYMALGVPAVVSPVGVNRSIIAHGRNGLLADTEEDWERELGRLLADESLRRRLGHGGRLTVERDFSARVHAPRVASILRGAARAWRRATAGAETGGGPSDQR